ncbi:hypothetical protein H9P43_001729 [Blastocladiella emersonii ATCC 22665]|nr:hypothetical protein H9P43_001729 [Blastocladiella emersonii ATCC 22665]
MASILSASVAAVQPEDESFVDEDILNSGLFNIEASSAFKFLDSLKSKEQIPAARVEELKQRHHTLYQFILTAFEYEKAMIKKTKALQAEVTKQRLEMDKTGAKVYDDNAEIGELKRELLRCQNEVVLAHEREAKYSVEIEEALITKESLIEDIEEIRRHKTDMLEPQLVANTKEIKLDLIQRKHQAENLEKDLEEKEQIYENVTKDKERLLAERERNEITLAKANEMPGKIMKQAEVLRDGIASLVIENVKQTQLAAQLEKDMEKLTKRRKDLEDEKASHAAEFDRRKEEMLERERACDEIFHEHEMAKDLLAVQESEKVRLHLTLKQLEARIKGCHESLIRCNRDKDHLIKVYRKLEGVVNTAVASVPAAKQHNHDVHLTLEATERESKHYRDAVRALRKEIEILMHSFIEGERHAAGDKELLATRIETNREIESAIDAMNKELEAIDRSIVYSKYEREMKARELLRMEAKARKGREDAQTREMEVLDATKKSQEAQVRLTEFAALYDKVKNERNRYVNLIASSQQRAMEMKEKSRILRSEVEILRNEIAHKDRELAKKRQENNAAYSQRDNSKMEANRLLVQYRDKRSLIDQQTGRIDTLSNSLSNCAGELATLKARYEQVVNERNAAGLQYLERNDELCMLYERNNIQERVMTHGEEELVDLEDRIRQLSLMCKELRRSVLVREKQLPVVDQLKAEYESLKSQVHEAKAQVLELSKIMESPDKSRVRDLKGEDPPQEALNARVHKLEMRLAQQEEKLLEKDLILEEIAHLTERLRSQAQQGRKESSQVMGRMNQVSRKLSQVSRTMMGLVAEISIAKTLAMALQAEVDGKRSLLEQVQAAVRFTDPLDAHAALEEPLAMSVPDLDAEWQRMESKREQRIEQAKRTHKGKKAAAATARGLDGQEGDWTLLPDFDNPTFLMPNGTKTTAEPRPNAYLPPLAEALPVAKPYGAHAPFKPSENLMSASAGGNLKYYRKPVVKEIEI